MLSISAVPRSGSYHDYLAAEYYAEGDSRPRWAGRGAAALGLSERVEASVLNQVLAGFAADGRPLVQNAGDDRRQPGWDLTFSVPKSVSVLWAVGPIDAREQIGESHRAAVREAIGYLDAEVAASRTGHSGIGREPVGLVAACYDHTTSRELDPQLHTHCVVANLGVSADGRTRTILSKPLYQHKMAAGAVYRATLADQLARRLGVEIAPTGAAGFEVAGVPQGLADELSKRSRQIRAAMAVRGQDGATAAAVAAHETRRAKEAVPLDELHRAWRECADRHRFTPQSVVELTGRRSQPTREAEQAARSLVQTAAADHLTAHSFITKSELLRAAAKHARTEPVAGSELVKAVSWWAERPDVIALAPHKGSVGLTTQAVIDLERSLMADAQQLASRPSHPVPEKCVEQAVAAHVGSGAGDDRQEKADAVRHLTGPQALSVLSGMAGTGKTTTLRACRQAWEEAGYTVTGVALAGIAARNLQTEAGIPSETLALRLTQLGRWPEASADSSSCPTRGHETFALDPKTVVVLDEAGMVGTRQMAGLVAAAREAGAKLVLVGDANQLQPIEAGGPFAAIGRTVGEARLTAVGRQKLEPNDPNPDWSRDAVKLFAAGKGREALALYAERGRVAVEADRDAARRTLVTDWLRAGGATDPKRHLIMTATNADAFAVNALCQRATTNPSALQQVLRGVRVRGEVLVAGDRVVFTKKFRPLGIENGHQGTVLDVSGLPGRRVMRAALDDGKIVDVHTARFTAFRLGYAVTTHKGQGRTVESAYVLLGGLMQDRHLTYVQGSRATDSTRFYVSRRDAGPKLCALAERVSRDNQKVQASSLLVANMDAETAHTRPRQ